LEQYFEVVVVSGDCDYGEVCETHEPDMALFESGVYAGPRHITSTAACPEVPKVGFCNSDAYCATRSVFLSDMERWGIETFFTLSVAMAEYTPDIADRLFIWPNFIDGDLFRDYGRPKSIPVLFTGSQAAHYPWRSRIHSIATQHYPCLTTPHGGWFDEKAAGRMVDGIRYAELLNAAAVAPTCGTIARDVLRKHFEIPGARTCLVTERTPALEAAGFVDMRNVVFAGPDDILDKLDYLFANPDEMRRITDAGFDLVHSRHTMAQRDQLRQWLMLHRCTGPGQKIVQSGPFDALRLVSSSPAAGNSHPISGGVDRSLLREGEGLLGSGRHRRAEELFLRCLNYHFMPEPVLGVTRCRLYAGDAAGAVSWVIQPIERSLVLHSAESPDPVEWSFYIKALLCQGNVREAVRRADQFPRMAHPELNRIRAVMSALAGRDEHPSEAPLPPARASVHVVPDRELEAWVEDLCIMLRSCGQNRIAAAVAATAENRVTNPDRALSEADLMARDRSAGLEVLPLVAERRHVRLKRRLRRYLGARWREMTADAPHSVLRSLAQRDEIHNALLIGASGTKRCTRAVLAGLRTNPNNPGIFWLDDATPSVLPGRDRRPGKRLTDARALAANGDGHIRRFEVILVGEHRELGSEERQALAKARYVVLTGVNRSATQRIHASLIEARDYALIKHHPSHDGGFSAFRSLRDP
jgi:hypothetical protein